LNSIRLPRLGSVAWAELEDANGFSAVGCVMADIANSRNGPSFASAFFLIEILSFFFHPKLACDVRISCHQGRVIVSSPVALERYTCPSHLSSSRSAAALSDSIISSIVFASDVSHLFRQSVSYRVVSEHRTAPIYGRIKAGLSAGSARERRATEAIARRES
jgi:hypothetical protein